MIQPATVISSVAEISAEWLTALLQPRFPGAVVDGFEVDTVIGGTATKIRLILTLNETGKALGLPSTLWLKAGFEANSASEHLRAIYLGEALFYRDLAAELNLGPPRAFAAMVEEGSGQSYILLEDLIPLGVSFGHTSQPLSPDMAAKSVQLLARLHARFWNSDALKGFDWLQGGGALIKSGVHDLTYAPELWNRCAALPRGQFMTGAMADREAMHGVMSRLLSYDLLRANCLVHGDAQLMNMYFLPDGTPGLLDWQTAMLGYWAHDLAEFIVTGLTVEDRRASERDLIRIYRQGLRDHGVAAPSEAEVWREYARHTAYTFHWMLCQPEWQPEPVCLLNAERAFAAIKDHDSLSSW